MEQKYIDLEQKILEYLREVNRPVDEDEIVAVFGKLTNFKDYKDELSSSGSYVKEIFILTLVEEFFVEAEVFQGHDSSTIRVESRFWIESNWLKYFWRLEIIRILKNSETPKTIKEIRDALAIVLSEMMETKEKANKISSNTKSEVSGEYIVYDASNIIASELEFGPGNYRILSFLKITCDDFIIFGKELPIQRDLIRIGLKGKTYDLKSKINERELYLFLYDQFGLSQFEVNLGEMNYVLRKNTDIEFHAIGALDEKIEYLINRFPETITKNSSSDKIIVKVSLNKLFDLALVPATQYTKESFIKLIGSKYAKETKTFYFLKLKKDNKLKFNPAMSKYLELRPLAFVVADMDSLHTSEIIPILKHLCNLDTEEEVKKVILENFELFSFPFELPSSFAINLFKDIMRGYSPIFNVVHNPGNLFRSELLEMLEVKKDE